MRRPGSALRSGYRLHVTTTRDRRGRPPAPLVEWLFASPAPRLEWTGDAVRRDAAGQDLYFVRHAMELPAEFLPESVACVTAPKLLVVDQLRSQTQAEHCAWLHEQVGDEVGRKALASLLAPSSAVIERGEQIAVAYEPRSDRTRVLWPSGQIAEGHGSLVMEAMWRCYFDTPGLTAALVRWAGAAT